MISIIALASSFERLYNFFNTLYNDNRSHMDQSYIDRTIVRKEQFKSYEKEKLDSNGVLLGYMFRIIKNNYVSSPYLPNGGSHNSEELGYLLICPDATIDYKSYGLNLESKDFMSKTYNDIFDPSPQFGVSKSIVIRNNPDVVMMDLLPEDIKYYEKFIYDIFISIINILDPTCDHNKATILANILTDAFITIMLIDQDIPYTLSKYTNNSKDFADFIEIFRSGRKPIESNTIKFIMNTYNMCQE